MADTARRRYRARMMTRPAWPRRWRGLAATLLVIGVAGCGDDPSAEERVCDARAELREAVDDVVADIEAGNFGDASDGTAAIGEAYDELASAVDELGQEQREYWLPMSKISELTLRRCQRRRDSISSVQASRPS